MECDFQRRQQTEQTIFKLIWVQCTLIVEWQHREGTFWITSYKVHVSTDGVTWKSYKENNLEKVTEVIYSRYQSYCTIHSYLLVRIDLFRLGGLLPYFRPRDDTLDNSSFQVFK